MAHSTIRESGFDVALGIIRRRKWAGLIAFAAALSLAVPFAVFLPDVYRGVVTVIVENQSTSATIVRTPLPELETRLIAIQQELLSRARLSALIRQLDLYPAWRQNTPMEGLVQRLRRDVRVDISRTDRGNPATIGLKISYIGLDAKSAAAVPNALAAMYAAENSRIRERQTGQVAEFLRSQVDAARNAVDTQQARINRFKELRAGHLPEQVSFNMIALERLNMRLRINADSQLRVRERQVFLSSDEPARGTPDELQALRVRLGELQTRFTAKHPDVIRMKLQIEELEGRLRTEPAPAKPAASRTGRAAGTEAELASLEREEEMLRAEISAYEQRIQSAPKVEQELDVLTRDYTAARESYSSILKRYEEAQLAETLEQTDHAESFRVLDAAVVPSFPAAPNRMRLLIMACFFAFASGVGMMLITEHLDTSFHTVGELRQFTTLPVLASIPYVPARLTLAGILRAAMLVIAVAGLCVLLAGFAYRTARENTQLVWMLSAPQL
ncbi:MAG TPA: GNVR domain-containing protein [Thermoanaerobaculia bacterium]|nr:GNVR domain-containing protein [Thermoanaerobaculia bacterium]